ncbi:small nuclear ribonucleoprotein Sm D2 [[Candida] jaroonii]|uniref:Small nuclear ribonucleoprotein Sm D2 n=1 Tax=[Candida] jaroonii TaxID=467808 RepID=A0ACA9YEL8_9ASCO|nr:small nuclear ribonucleoprotein Sm D2 [[Candida] jaroonii]
MAEVNMDVSEGAKNDPFTIMSESVRDKTKIVISCRNNHKLVGSLKAYDHHCNMILEEVKDIWSEPIKNGKGEVVDTNARERYIHKMFLRGDTVVVVMKL